MHSYFERTNDMNTTAMKTLKHSIAWILASGLMVINAQAATVNAICSTDQSWCEMAAQAYTKATGVTVL